MVRIVPTRTYKERKVMRQVKAYLWRQWACALAFPGMVSAVAPLGRTLPVWLLVVCFIFVGLMLVAAVGAVVYLFVEKPQEVTLRIYDRDPSFLIHLNGKD
jgi:hypothetical protein